MAVLALIEMVIKLPPTPPPPAEARRPWCFNQASGRDQDPKMLRSAEQIAMPIVPSISWTFVFFVFVYFLFYLFFALRRCTEHQRDEGEDTDAFVIPSALFGLC